MATSLKELLLGEYRVFTLRADQHWNEYLETESAHAFNEYLAINRVLSDIYVQLVNEGMTLEQIQKWSR